MQTNLTGFVNEEGMDHLNCMWTPSRIHQLSFHKYFHSVYTSHQSPSEIPPSYPWLTPGTTLAASPGLSIFKCKMPS